ncbi:acyl-CoA dehydrogenase family protein, partial [Gordonia araii]
EIREMGRLAGTAEAREWGRLAERVPPRLLTHDRYGHRIDEVEYVPAYHELMKTAIGHGLGGTAWADDRPGAHVARAAKSFAWGTVDPGHLCPVSMTYAVVPALRANPELAARFEPLLTNRVYDFGLRDPATKSGLIAGMSMTEKQGGSDVRANTTTATPIDGEPGAYRIVGHKWFTSAPMSDLFLTLAQAPGGLSCFLLPRVLPGGDLNPIRFQRLKDKLGNKSNASAEIEYENAVGWLVGEEGRGVKTIVEMVNMTRLDCVVASASGMRSAFVQAAHHARHRSVFGKPLVDQPLMRNVLADLALESEAATTVMMRLAGAHDRAIHGDDGEAALRRIGLAATKYYVCKRGPIVAAEALECLGGNGYIEDFDMARLYREMPLMSIWEGSGNVAALDTLRAMAREPHTVDAFFAEADLASGADPRYDDALTALKKELTYFDDIELRARRIVEQMALVLQAGLLIRTGPDAVAQAYCASRLDRDWGTVFGTLPPQTDIDAILKHAEPI